MTKESSSGMHLPALRRNGSFSDYERLQPGKSYDRALLCVLAFVLVGAFYVTVRGGPTLSNVEEMGSTPREITPLPVPRVSDLKQFGGEHRERLYWGTYRPMAYLGIRARTPKSLLAGLMWNGERNGQYLLRHYYEESDGLARGSWLRHDGSTYGRQLLVDGGLAITVYFLKSKEGGSGYGGDWVVRIKVESSEVPPAQNEEVVKTQSIFFYMADESGKAVNLWPKHNKTAEDSPFAGGSADEIGGWQLHAKYPEKVCMNYAGLRQTYMPGLTHLVHTTLEDQRDASGSFRLPDTSVKDPNVAVIQLTGTLPFEIDMAFVSGVDKQSAQVQSRIQNLTGSALHKRFMKQEVAFEERFRETFKLHEKVQSEEELETGRGAISNMLGGIGYFYGRSRIEIPPEFQEHNSSADYWEYWPASLYTAVPSQPIYPRGFLWDEGFHQLLISRWDRKISMEIIANWLDLMNIDGWIPREQILGDEARSKVPPDFINQKPDNANPPALLLPLREMGEAFLLDQKNGRATVDDTEFFRTIFPRLAVWFDWFNVTQTGKDPDSYYWRGRVLTDDKLNPPTLTSGMDDYPRASHPSDDERHVDLRCWIATASDSMAVLARVAGAPPQKYEETYRKLTNLTRLNELHYDHNTGRYYDYGNHSEQVELQWKDVKDPVTGLTYRELKRVVLKPPKLGWVPQFGLNSLFPFAMSIIPPDSPILGHHLDMLEAPELMWTDFGLRSLGTTSSIYMKYNSQFEAPYWRGPVWISINYLVLSALHGYAQDPGPYQERASILYKELRNNLIRNIVQRYQETGYIWENYDNAAEGKGLGAHPFTGWTSLVVLMMGEIYI